MIRGSLEWQHRFELGIKTTSPAARSMLTAYYADVSDFILRDRAHLQTGVLLADNASIYRQVDATLVGLDYVVDHQWSTTWMSQLTLNYAYAENNTDNRPIAQTAPLKLAVSLEHQLNAWRWGGRIRGTLKQNRIDDDADIGSGLDVGPTPGYAVLDVYLNKKINPQTQIEVGVHNVLDKTYAEHLNQVNNFDVVQSQINEPGVLIWMKAGMNF